MQPIDPRDVHAVLARYMLADGWDVVLDLEKSHGAILHDSLHNVDYLDLFSCYAAMPLGFGHPKLRDAAYQAKLLRAANLKPSNPDVYTRELAEFVESFGLLITRGQF